MTKPVIGGDNSSNTAVATRALRAVKRLPFVAIESLPFIDHFADKLDSAAAARAMRQAARGMPRRVEPLPSAAFARQLVVPTAAGVETLSRRRGDQ